MIGFIGTTRGDWKIEDYPNAVRIRELWAQGEADCLASDADRVGIVLDLPVIGLLIVGVLGNAQIVNSDADVLALNGGEKIVAFDATARFADHDGIQVIRVAGVGLGVGGRADMQAVERLVVPVPDLLPALPVGLDALQLMNTHRGLDVHHVVFEPRLDHLVMHPARIAEALPRVLAHAVQCQHLDPRGLLVVLRDHDAALTRDHVLGHVETETPELAEESRLAAVVLGFDGVGAVFDDHEVVLLRERRERVHVAGATRKMHRHDGARARGDHFGHAGGVDVHGDGIDIGQHRRGAGMNDGIDRRAERERRGDDLIPFAHTGRHHGQVQRRRAREQRHRVGRALVLAERFLEARHFGAGADPAALDAGHDLVDLFLMDVGGAECQETIFGTNR